jgi:superfamily II DNA or RNA helicase
MEKIPSWNVMEIQHDTLYAEKLDEVYMRVFGDASIEQELADFFTYEYPGARFTPQYKARLWDGKVRLYDQFRKTLYIGLYEYLEKFCERNGYMLQTKGEVIGQEDVPKETVQEFTDWLNLRGRGNPIEVRDYQLDAIHTALVKQRTLLLSPTASGKSLIIYSTMRWHLNNKRKCILIVPTTSLVEQMYADFEDYSSANGFSVQAHCQKLYSGFPKEFTKDVLITTWQSIYLQPKSWFRQFDVIFGDEAHQFKAKSLTSVMEKLDTVKYRVGTTGTLDNKKIHQLVLEGIFGAVHRVTTTKALMDSGKLTSLNITCLILKYSEEIRRERNKNTYQDEMDWLVTNPKRNKFIRNLAVNSKGNTLVLFQYVEKHGKVLYDLIRDKVHEDRKVFFVFGGTETSDREAIRHITEGEEDAIIIASYGTFSTGINIPSIENVIFASPSKSKIRNLQSIGRGLRLKDGKTACNLYDIADDLHWKSWKNHTLNHAAERYKTYVEEEFKLKMVEVNL